MNLAPYVDTLRQELLNAAEAGGRDAHALAEQLMAPLDSATRLVLLEALSAAASAITLDLAPGSVDVRLRGRDPEFVVTHPPGGSRQDETSPPPAGDARNAPAEAGDSGAARITLRLTEQLKGRIEEAAGREGLSVNAWLGRAITASLDQGGGNDRAAGRAPPGGRRFTGWVR